MPEKEYDAYPAAAAKAPPATPPIRAEFPAPGETEPEMEEVDWKRALL